MASFTFLAMINANACLVPVGNLLGLSATPNVSPTHISDTAKHLTSNATISHYQKPVAVDRLVGNVQKFMLLVGVERGFPASIIGNG
jgi:hypothetical protein